MMLKSDLIQSCRATETLSSDKISHIASLLEDRLMRKYLCQEKQISLMLLCLGQVLITLLETLDMIEESIHFSQDLRQETLLKWKRERQFPAQDTIPISSKLIR